MSLILTVYNTPFWEIFTNASGLALATETSSQIKTSEAVLDTPQPLTTLSALLSGATGDQTLWLAAVQAEYFIANALESGMNVEDAAQEWEHQTKGVLELHRQHRKRLNVFNVYQALTNPIQFCDAVAPRLSISPFTSHKFEDNIYLLAACQYVVQRSDLQELNARLHASSLSIADDYAPHINISLILLQNQAIHSASKDRDSILTQLHLVQEQLEAHHTQHSTVAASLTKERDDAVSQLHETQEKLEAKLSQSSNEIASLSTERDAILLQLHLVQEELEKHHIQNSNEIDILSKERDEARQRQDDLLARCKTLEKNINELESQSSSLQKKLDNILEEKKLALEALDKSERNLTQLKLTLEITRKEQDESVKKFKAQTEEFNLLQQNFKRLEAELKKTTQERDIAKNKINSDAIENAKKSTDIQALKINLQSTEEERDLILSQLHQVQEQLEHYYITLQNEQKTNKHTLLARDKQNAKEIAKLESELRKMKARAASAEYAGNVLTKELDSLRKTLSWKAAKPMRAFGRLIKKSDPAHSKLVQEIGLLLTSEYFDVDWYLRTYTDVADCQMNPAEHYLLYGAAEGRLPGPLFDGNWYLQHYPDVAESKINPLLHFIVFGQQEGRASSPLLLTNNSIEEEQ